MRNNAHDKAHNVRPTKRRCNERYISGNWIRMTPILTTENMAALKYIHNASVYTCITCKKVWRQLRIGQRRSPLSILPAFMSVNRKCCIGRNTKCSRKDGCLTKVPLVFPQFSNNRKLTQTHIEVTLTLNGSQTSQRGVSRNSAKICF